MKLKKFTTLALILILSAWCGSCGVGSYTAPHFALEPQSPSPKADGKNLKLLNEATPIPFLTDYVNGVRYAEQESKPMLLFFALHNNANSQKMLETTFRDNEIQRLAQRFVCVKIDSSENVELCDAKNVKGFPTILLLNSQGGELQRLLGKQSPDQLAVQMHVVLQSTAAKIGTVIRK